MSDTRKMERSETEEGGERESAEALLDMLYDWQ
jgi:hypothetical protein